MRAFIFLLSLCSFVFYGFASAQAKPVDAMVANAKADAELLFYANDLPGGFNLIAKSLNEAEGKFGKSSVEVHLLRHMTYVKSSYIADEFFRSFPSEDIFLNSKFIKSKFAKGSPEYSEADLLLALVDYDTSDMSKYLRRLASLADAVYINGGDTDFAYSVLYSVSGHLRRNKNLEFSNPESRIEIANKLVSMSEKLLHNRHVENMWLIIEKAFLVRAIELAFAGTDVLPGIFVERTDGMSISYFRALQDIKKYRLLIGDTSNHSIESHYSLVAIESFVKALFLERVNQRQESFDMEQITYSESESKFVNSPNFLFCPSLPPHENERIVASIPEDVSNISIVMLYDVKDNQATNFRLAASFEPGFESDRPQGLVESINRLKDIRADFSDKANCAKDRLLVLTLIE